MYYTYAHYTADKSRLFYIGKGKNNRLNQKHSRSKHWNSIVEKHGLHVELLANWNTEEEAFEHEKFLIACFKPLTKLCNHTDGGDGISGYYFTEEQKQKLRGRKPHNFGKKLTAEERLEIGRKQFGIKRGPQSDEHSQRISQALKGKKKSKEHIEKVKLALLSKGKIEQICPHCQVKGFGPNIFKYHFDNCQRKGNVWN
jgi:hypothetical protein